MDETPEDVLTMMIWSSSGQSFSFTFELVHENCVSYMLQAAGKPPHNSYMVMVEVEGVCRGKVVTEGRTVDKMVVNPLSLT